MEKNIMRRRHSVIRFLPVMIMLGLPVVGGCTAKQAGRLPPISPAPTGQHQVGRFVWFDLLTEDVRAAQDFYGELFGWRFAASEQVPGYHIIYSGDRPIGGVAPHEDKDPKVQESLWLGSLSVEDVDVAISTVRARSGEVVEGPFDVKGRGRMAVIRDPEGAELVLIRAAGGDPPDAGTKPGDWLWADLFTRNAKTAIDFYGVLAGYTAQTVKTGGDHSYNLLTRNGRAFAGVVELPWKGVEPNWLPYVRVSDLEETIGRAATLGGILILRHENVAVIADPSGGVFGIQMVKGKRA